MNRYGLPENPSLATTSRLRMWWLHAIWGYTVISKHSRPHTGAFGLTFEDEYLLLPRQHH